jgi:hypothetical protein
LWHHAALLSFRAVVGVFLSRISESNIAPEVKVLTTSAFFEDVDEVSRHF